MNRGFSICLLVLAISLCPQVKFADAAIYWAERPSIGRVNLDGSHPEPGFIAEMGTPRIYGACGLAVNETHVFWADSGRGAIGRARLDGTERDYEFISGASDPCGVALTDSHVLWANRDGSEGFKDTGTIGRARLDGTDVDQSFVENAGMPCGVAANESHLFWPSNYHETIARADIDGGAADTHFIEGAGGACGIALGDPFLYWGTYEHSIGRARLDGSEAMPHFITGLARPCAVAVFGGRLYWTEEGPATMSVGQANLDGTNVNRAVVTGLQMPCGIAVDGLSFQPPPPPPERPTVCFFRGVGHDRSAGALTVGIRAPLHGEIRIRTTRGLVWRRLPVHAPSGQRVWWTTTFKVWPRTRGRVGMRLRRRLRRDGRVSIELRVLCDGVEEAPTSASRRLWLYRSDVTRSRSRDRRRP